MAKYNDKSCRDLLCITPRFIWGNEVKERIEPRSGFNINLLVLFNPYRVVFLKIFPLRFAYWGLCTVQLLSEFFSRP